ncbi:hypothetical protein TYRP_019374 [Tyrophagus putrescentiae]|nr:hypothetical protein TYRP_019374 [Tyrophagus putrescentiae]
MTSSSSTPSLLRAPFFPGRSLVRSSRSASSSTSQSRRARRTARRSLSSQTAPVVVVSMPVVDLNNNNSSSNLIAAAPVGNGAPVVQLDRVAILKAFASVSQAEQHSNSGASITSSSSVAPSSAANRTSRYEKPTSYREARRRQLRPVSLSDPAIEQELIRLRDSVPSIAGSNASDLTIINEAISLICDLESQLIRKLKCQTLPVLPPISS